HVLPIPSHARAADTDRPAGVFHSRDNPATVEHAVRLDPQGRTPLTHRELVALGERPGQRARPRQNLRNVSITKRNRPIQNLARREGLENDTGSVNHESAPYQTAVS